MGATLVPFSDDSSETVLAWVLSASEAERWAGVTEWPLPVGLLARFHAEADVHPFLLNDSEGVSLAYGEVWVDEEEDEAELARLLVDPTQRGQGNGRALVILLVEQARAVGYSDIWLRVVPENTQARACYRSAGFVRASEAEEAAFNVGQPAEYVWMRA